MNQPIHTFSSAKPIEVFGPGAASSTGGWSSLSVKRTASFGDIHQEVSQSINLSPAQASSVPLYAAEEGTGGRPGGVPTTGNGDTPPPTGQLQPVGDMLIPMLVIALGYVVVKIFRNRKLSRTL